MHDVYTGSEFYRRSVKKWIPIEVKAYLEAKYDVGFIRSRNTNYGYEGIWIESVLPVSRRMQLILDIELSEYILVF